MELEDLFALAENTKIIQELKDNQESDSYTVQIDKPMTMFIDIGTRKFFPEISIIAPDGTYTDVDYLVRDSISYEFSYTATQIGSYTIKVEAECCETVSAGKYELNLELSEVVTLEPDFIIENILSKRSQSYLLTVQADKIATITAVNQDFNLVMQIFDAKMPDSYIDTVSFRYDNPQTLVVTFQPAEDTQYLINVSQEDIAISEEYSIAANYYEKKPLREGETIEDTIAPYNVFMFTAMEGDVVVVDIDSDQSDSGLNASLTNATLIGTNAFYGHHYFYINSSGTLEVTVNHDGDEQLNEGTFTIGIEKVIPLVITSPEPFDFRLEEYQYIVFDTIEDDVVNVSFAPTDLTAKIVMAGRVSNFEPNIEDSSNYTIEIDYDGTTGIFIYHNTSGQPKDVVGQVTRSISDSLIETSESNLRSFFLPALEVPAYYAISEGAPLLVTRVQSDSGSELVVWNIYDGKSTVPATMSDFGNVAVSSNYIALSGSQELRLITVEGAAVSTIDLGKYGYLEVVALSNTGEILVTVNEDYTLQVWNTQDGDLIKELNGLSYYPDEVIFSPDDSRLVAAESYDTIVWYISQGEILYEIDAEAPIAFNRNGTQFFSVDFDNSVKVWDAATFTPINSLTGHDYPIFDLAVSPDDRYLATISPADSHVKVWSLDSFEEVSRLEKSNALLATFLSPEGDLVVLTDYFDGVNYNYSVTIWNIPQ